MILLRRAWIAIFVAGFSLATWAQEAPAPSNEPAAPAATNESTANANTTQNAAPTAVLNTAADTNAKDGAIKKPNENLSSLNYNVFLETKDLRFNVGLFLQFSSFEREGQSLVGNPYEVLAGYALTEKLGFNLNLMQALDMANGASVLYTGVRTSASYNLFGKNFSQRSTVMINGEPSVSIAPFYEPTFGLDIGFEQLFFNGVSRVAPGTGMSVGALYTRTISTYRLAVMARYGQLTVGEDPVSLMTAGIGLIYRF